jgi:glucose dehydrogenase
LLDGRSSSAFGAETASRFVDAYDEDRKLVWRTYTIPAPGEPGSDTWGKGDGWKTGGGSTWLTGSFDPELNLLYWATGNPAPDWNSDNRPGDNLYTDSVLALDPTNGKMKWHFQFTPEDLHDWDANETLVLFDAPVGGRDRKLIAQANRNGFYYVLDRATGEYLASAQYAKQTWADGIDAKGRRSQEGISWRKARWCSRTSRARRTGSARATVRRRSCSIRPRATWGRSTTRARPCTSPAPHSPAAAAARSTATSPAARSARSRRRRGR